MSYFFFRGLFVIAAIILTSTVSEARLGAPSSQPAAPLARTKDQIKAMLLQEGIVLSPEAEREVQSNLVSIAGVNLDMVQLVSSEARPIQTRMGCFRLRVASGAIIVFGSDFAICTNFSEVRFIWGGLAGFGGGLGATVGLFYLESPNGDITGNYKCLSVGGAYRFGAAAIRCSKNLDINVAASDVDPEIAMYGVQLGFDLSVTNWLHQVR